MGRALPSLLVPILPVCFMLITPICRFVIRSLMNLLSSLGGASSSLPWMIRLASRVFGLSPPQVPRLLP